MAPPGDVRREPVTQLDAKDFVRGAVDHRKVARKVQQDLRDFNRALKEKGWTAEIEIPDEETVAGYVSNVRAWIENETRRVNEVVVDLTAGAANRLQVTQYLKELTFRDGTFDLSVSSHARAAGRLGVFDFVQRNGIEHLMMVVPAAAEERIAPDGILSRYVGRVFKVDEWQRISRELNRDRGGLSLVFGLGLHHNDPHQMVPVTPSKLLAFAKVAKGYRERLLHRIKRRARDEGTR